MDQPLARHFLYSISFNAHGAACGRCYYHFQMGTLRLREVAPPEQSPTELEFTL